MKSGVKGRGAAGNPRNRFERFYLEPDEEVQAEEIEPATEFYRDKSRSLLAFNQSPDVGFDVSINPYRGCEHGCIYCYARPSHEYLGFSAGLDFESKILVKENAPDLLRTQLSSPGWKPQVIALSGVTDPYQPVERRLKITRRCLEVLLEFRNPVAIVTKSYLVTRDIDLLKELASDQAVAVNLSITSLDRGVQSLMEPRASTPQRRLQAIRELADANIPVRVLVAPVVPGLTDHEMPAIVRAAVQSGATAAGYVSLRLPYGVKGLFENWLDDRFPLRKKKVLQRIREIRGGRLYNSNYHSRMRGEGQYADQLKSLFEVSCRSVGLRNVSLTLSTSAFRRPGPQGQLPLF